MESYDIHNFFYNVYTFNYVLRLYNCYFLCTFGNPTHDFYTRAREFFVCVSLFFLNYSKTSMLVINPYF